MEEDFNKPTFRPNFVSEFSMGQYDFNRYDKWLQWVEQWNAQIHSTDVPTLDMIQHWFAGLNVLWQNWRPIVGTPRIKSEVDEKIKEALKLKRLWENSKSSNTPISKVIKLKLVDTLNEINTKIMDIKQIIGLGVPVKRNLTTSERIKSGMKKEKGINFPDK